MLKRRTKYGPIGLDIGASSIKLLQLGCAGGEPCVRAAAFCEIPPCSAADRAEKIRIAVASALRRNPFHGNHVVTCFGHDEIQMKNLRLPKMPREELATAVEFEARERFDFGDSIAQIRFVPVGEVRHGNELKEEVIVFAALDSLVQERLEMLESLKLIPDAIDIAPCALARSFVRFLRRTEDNNAINVFLEIGYRGSCLVMTRGSDISFLKQIDVGGGQFNAAAAKALAVPESEAADLRVRIMRECSGRRAEDKSAVPPEIKAAVNDAIRPSVERLCRDVQLCMRYFAVTFRGQKPESITLVGGEAYEDSLARTLSETIDVPTLIGHPLRGISRLGTIGGRDRRTLQPAWAVVGGLALRGSELVQTDSKPIVVRQEATIGVQTP